MDFRMKTYVICRAFLLASIDKEEHTYLLHSTNPSADDHLTCVPGGEEIVQCLLDLVNEFDRRFNRSFAPEPIAEQLGLNGESPININSLEQSYLEVLDNLFEKLNWGRIIAMFAFLRILVIRLLKHKHVNEIHSLIDTTSKYCDEKLKSWINSHDGWPGLLAFHDHQPLNDKQEFIRWALKNVGGFATGAVGALGIAAIMGYIANKI